MQLLLFFSVDIQFYVFMHSATDLSKDQIYRVFDMLDVDNSGLLDFDEFYLLVCILLAVRVSMVKSECSILMNMHSVWYRSMNTPPVVWLQSLYP